MLEALSLRPVSAVPLQRAQLRKIALVGSFPPRRCGIASFTSDLAAAISGARSTLKCEVIAVSDGLERYEYGAAVGTIIDQDDADSYAAAAARVHDGNVDAVSLQHEFGIFGGPAGAHILKFTSELKRPLFTTLHTVLERPDRDQRTVLERLIEQSKRVIVMTRKGRDILAKAHPGVEHKVEVIPHGAPDRPFRATAEAKARLGLADRDVVLTFGLLSPNKGIETVIRALPAIAAVRPQVVYLVVGATHPHLVACAGEQYRGSLVALARELDVSKHVRFVDAFVTPEVLTDHLAAADIYVTPYLSEAQVTSGTLAHALAMGKAVVSTPYWHAEEVLQDGKGILVDFGAQEQFAAAITGLLADEKARLALAKRAYAASREATWPRTGERYVDLMEKSAGASAQIPARARRQSLPKVSLRALERMSDACGMLQHARFGVPDRNHGYCLDDNARALVAAQRLLLLDPGNRAAERLAPVYAAFIEHAWNEKSQAFRNFMSYDRAWLEEAGSCDSCGRALWALGETAAYARDKDLRAWALHLAERAAQSPQRLGSLRSKAFSAIGFQHLGQAGYGAAGEQLEHLGDALYESLRASSAPGWTWFEETLGYDNARLPEALLRAGSALQRREYVDAAIEALDWLAKLHTHPDGSFAPVGTGSFERRYQSPEAYDQQPLEAGAAVDANWTAFELTGDVRWAAEARRAFAWFLGANSLGAELALPEIGACCDGLGRDGVNRNQGGESILSYLMALCAMRVRERSPRRALV